MSQKEPWFENRREIKKASTKGDCLKTGALGGIRTHNLLIRSQMLYPIELRAHHHCAETLIQLLKFKCKQKIKIK